jgi:CHAD domain-containing protein
MAGRRAVEVELKYEVPVRGAADGYLVAPRLGPYRPGGQARATRVEDRYVDTAGRALERAGYAARLRTGSRGTEIGLKAMASAGGKLHRREELEGPADPSMPPRDWPDSVARTAILELCGDEPLGELLSIRQLRHVRKLIADDAATEAGAAPGTAELSVDRVEVYCGGVVVDSFDELEVELRSGPEAPLVALAAVLDRDRNLGHVTRSKLERASAAVRANLARLPQEARLRWEPTPEPKVGKPARRRRHRQSAGETAATETPQAAETPPVVEAAPTGLDDGREAVKQGPRTLDLVADDTMPEAARKILSFHFARMRKREAGTREGLDAEELHDMRVAVRRMRAAWRVFDGTFKPGRTKPLRRRLRTLSDKLGAVRDLDVLIEGLEAYCDGLDEEQRPGTEPLLELWRRQRETARRQLIEELDSRGYAGFVRDMDQFLSAGANSAASVAVPTVPHRVRDRAPSLIWSAYESVRAYELVLPWADVETIHQLRIATKWLRYTLEFFGETLGRDGAMLLARVVALQDYLGCFHDADVAAKLARDVLVALAGELTKVEAEAIGSYLHSRERELARRRRSLGPVWRAVDGAPFRRALGRATAAV